MTDYSLSEAEWEALFRTSEAPGGRGPSFDLASNVDSETDRIRTRRVGPAGGGLKARACVFTESITDEGETLTAVAYFSAPEARQLAAALLNIADDIDGKTPLAFFPRTPSGEEAPEVEELTAADVAGTALFDFATVTGDAGATGHAFREGDRVQVLSLYVAADGLPCAYCRGVARPGLFQVVAQADLDTISHLSEEGQ